MRIVGIMKFGIFVNLFLKLDMIISSTPTLRETHQNPSSPNDEMNNNNIYEYFSLLSGLNINPDNMPYYFATNLSSCNYINCPINHGVCINSSTCQCRKGFVTNLEELALAIYEGNYDDFAFCCYEQKRQLVAFLLEFFVQCGAGHFYVKKYARAAPKLVVTIMVYFASMVAAGGNGGEVLVILPLGLFAWNLADWIMYGINAYNDGNKMPLEKW